MFSAGIDEHKLTKRLILFGYHGFLDIRTRKDERHLSLVSMWENDPRLIADMSQTKMLKWSRTGRRPIASMGDTVLDNADCWESIFPYQNLLHFCLGLVGDSQQGQLPSSPCSTFPIPVWDIGDDKVFYRFRNCLRLGRQLVCFWWQKRETDKTTLTKTARVSQLFRFLNW